MILTINCGSSSLKFQLYDWSRRLPLAVGLVERLGQEESSLEVKVYGGEEIAENRSGIEHRAALTWAIESLQQRGVLANLAQIEAVGHRVLHGGETFQQSTLIDEHSLALFDSLVGLGPLHMPPALIGVRVALELFPSVPHTAVMDTAWHATIPPENYLYALPRSWYEQHLIRRYGFHGTSFLYTAKRAAVLLGKEPQTTNLIIVHIGNGSSICAVKNGVSYDTSMGLTPLEGLVMGTRCGDIDPAIILHIMDRLELSTAEMNEQLNKKSGLLGLAGYLDRRDVVSQAQQGDLHCQQALAIECRRVKKYIGAYAAQLGRVDAVVFTAGVGEMSPIHRQRMLAELEFLGIKIDEWRNAQAHSRNCETRISAADSAVQVLVIPTDEELVMTEDALAVKEGRYDQHLNFHYSFQDRDYVNQVRQEALAKELERNPELAKIIAHPPRS